MKTVTLMTDFGLGDPYVAAMKGVILSVCPGVQLVDVSHEIPRHDVWDGGYVWASCYGYFPMGTVHVGVVDPGVGGDRRALAMRIAGHVFICPDNGLISWIADGCEVVEAVELREERYFRAQVSATFHGRDVFAPVAGHVAKGMALTRLGPPAEGITRLAIPKAARTSARELAGEVIHVDRFGNAITNISAEECLELEGWSEGAAVVDARGKELRGLRRTYAQARPGDALAYFGSTGKLELAVNMGSAAEALELKRGDEVRVSTRSDHR